MLGRTLQRLQILQAVTTLRLHYNAVLYNADSINMVTMWLLNICPV